ncbi:MAG: hypothetical protein EHM21_19075 [Chloroflexi bacterium]|nr:MAG: hypothetical protein EHM21_19075 [Chloroflexota bacterium]
MEPGTLALFDVMPLNRYSDNDLTAMLNWTYAPESRSMQISYKFFDLTLRLGSNIAGLPGFEKDLPVEHNQRGTFFKTTTSSTLALTYNPPACLKILGTEDALLPDLPERLQRALPMTRLEQIRTGGTPARPPAVLGKEPAHGWCYYFQKTELARQQGDWPMLVSFADQAFEAGLNPGDPAELLPMIEGYARVGNLDRAASFSREAGKQANLHPALCAVWERVGEQIGKDQETAAKAAAGERSELNCLP